VGVVLKLWFCFTPPKLKLVDGLLPNPILEVDMVDNPDIAPEPDTGLLPGNILPPKLVLASGLVATKAVLLEGALNRDFTAGG
jgi:hypothetical protein